ncbi:MAG: hypothetical protein ABI415_10650 [Flavitalea sp.]
MENTLNLQSPWTEVKEKLKEHNIALTDNDLNFQPGKEGELLSHLAGKLHKSRQEIKEYIESVSSNKTQAG